MTDSPKDTPGGAGEDATVHFPTWQPPAATPPPPPPPAAAPPPPPAAPTGDYYAPPSGGHGYDATQVTYGAAPGYPQYPGAQQPGQPPVPPPGYQPGQHPAPATTDWSHTDPSGATVTVPKTGRGRLPVILGAVVAVIVAALLITGFWLPGFLRSQQLDVNAVQNGVRQVLTDSSHGYGATNVTDVVCNNGANPTIKQGDTFTCDVTIGGDERQVTVTFGDNSGTYWVGAPS